MGVLTLASTHDGKVQGTAVRTVSCRLQLGEELGRGVEGGGSAPDWVQCLHDGRWGRAERRRPPLVQKQPTPAEL